MEDDNLAPVTEDRIQSLVRGIVGELFVPENRPNNRPRVDQQFGVIEEEINHRFRLPRTSPTDNNNTIHLNSPSPLTPRNDVNNSPVATSSMNCSIPEQRNSAEERFNPLRNYGLQQRSGPGPTRQRGRSRSNTRRRANIVHHANKPKSSSERNEYFLKDVCLLPSPTYAKVPRREYKVHLQRRGLYVDAYRFDKRWDERTIRQNILQLFAAKLTDEASFDFVKATGTEILPVNLPNEQKITGRVVKHIAATGPVYIRASCDIESDSEDEVDSVPSDIRNYLPSGSTAVGASAGGSTCTSSHAKIQCIFNEDQEPSTSREALPEQIKIPETSDVTLNNNGVRILSEMFPSMERREIYDILEENNMDVELSINVILHASDPVVLSCELTQNSKDTDSDDTDMEIMLNSPLSSTALVRKNGNAFDHLQRFVAAAVQQFGQELDVHIDRKSDILEQVLRKYKNPAFDLTKPLNVRFVGEPGLDAGGVTREFFHLLMKRMQAPGASFNLFEGRIGHLLPTYNYDMISGGLFILAGKMVLHAVLNNCTGMQGLSRAAIGYLSSGSRDAAVQHITLADIPDPVIQENLDKLLHCKEEQLPEFTSTASDLNISDILVSSGFPHICITKENRQMAYECCLVYEVLGKRLSALDDFRKGLGSICVFSKSCLELLAKFPELSARFFPPAQEDVIDLEVLRDRLEYQMDDADQNKECQVYFNSYLCELSERVEAKKEKLDDLLQFWTGNPTIPLGDSKLVVTFLEANPSKVLPEANTCPMVLHIPTIHKSYQDFKANMDKAISYSKFGFGKI